MSLNALDGVWIAFPRLAVSFIGKGGHAIMAGENWTFWLNMTNFALGIITLVATPSTFVDARCA